MDTVVDPPAPAPPAPPTPLAAPAVPATERPCAHCGAALSPGQDWCLECGAGAPMAGAGHPVWRPAVTVLALTALLVIGTVAAAYAALKSPGRRTVTHPATVALTPSAPSATPAAPAPPAAPALTPTPKPGPVSPAKALTPPAAVHAATPAATANRSTSTTASSTTHTTTSPTAQPSPTPSTPAPSGQGTAVVIDPGAASTYNPGGYPDSAFGDPSLSVDGDPSTAWSARAQSGHAPTLDAGVVIDLNTPQRLSALTLVSHTPGISVGIYGANGDQPPARISSGWRLLSSVRQIQRSTDFSLNTSGTHYRFVLVWVTRVASGSIADLNEINLTH